LQQRLSQPEGFHSYGEAQHTIMGRLLTLKGVKPHGFTQWPRDNFYLYGIERLWEYIKAQLRWQNSLSIDDLRQQVYAILAQMTPSLIASLTSWDFIITAISRCN
jgi:hypothetical protein